MSGFQWGFAPAPSASAIPPTVGQLFNTPRPSTAPARDFREYAKRLAPPWLSYLMGERFVGFLGLMWDVLAEGAMLATTARSMLSRSFPEDALYLIGSERNLPRYPGETLESYADRLWNAWSIWMQAGSDIGLIEQYEVYGATCQVIHNSDWNWDEDQDESRVFLVLTDHGFVRNSQFGDGKIFGGGQTFGSSASADQVRAARQIARTLRPAHMRVEKIVVIVDDSAPFTPPDGTWDDPTQRSPQAVYWAG